MDRALAVWWRAVALLGAIERVAGVFLIALMVVTITVQVVTRYAFGQPLVWVEELATYSFIWSVFLGAALGVKEMRHIRIETFLDRIRLRAAARRCRCRSTSGGTGSTRCRCSRGSPRWH